MVLCASRGCLWAYPVNNIYVEILKILKIDSYLIPAFLRRCCLKLAMVPNSVIGCNWCDASFLFWMW